MKYYFFLKTTQPYIYILILSVSGILPQFTFWNRLRKRYSPYHLPDKFFLGSLIMLLSISFYVVCIIKMLPGGLGGEFLISTLYYGVFFFPCILFIIIYVAHFIYYRDARIDKSNRIHIIFFAVSAVFLLLIGVDMSYIEPYRLEISEEHIHDERLSQLTKPLKILLMADTHFDDDWPKGYAFIERAYQMARHEFEPDIILLGGDHVNRSDPPKFLPFFQKLQAPHGVFAVHGNFSVKDAPIKRYCRNIRFLDNEYVELNIHDAKIALIGVGFADIYKLSKITKQIPNDLVKILLCHTPDALIPAKSEKIPFLFAGHTHGGQVCIPFVGAVITLTELGPAYASGLFKEKETWMYVTRGLGLEVGAIPKIRFWCRPEIVCITLKGT